MIFLLIEKDVYTSTSEGNDLWGKCEIFFLIHNVLLIMIMNKEKNTCFYYIVSISYEPYLRIGSPWSI